MPKENTLAQYAQVRWYTNITCFVCLYNRLIFLYESKIVLVVTSALLVQKTRFSKTAVSLVFGSPYTAAVSLATAKLEMLALAFNVSYSYL